MNNLVQQVKMSMAYGDLWVEITADGVSYAPDAVDDMVQHMGNGYKRQIVLDGSPDFPTMLEAQQYADAFNKSESWSR